MNLAASGLNTAPVVPYNALHASSLGDEATITCANFPLARARNGAHGAMATAEAWQSQTISKKSPILISKTRAPPASLTRHVELRPKEGSVG